MEETVEGMVQEPQPRKFEISPKTPYSGGELFDARLKDMNFSVYSGARAVVAEDMIENVRELTGNNTIDAAMPNFRVHAGRHNYYGLEAIENSVASPLGSLLRSMKLGMSSPEGVFMSGHVIHWALDTSLQKANERVSGIGSGLINFATPEAREADLNKNKKNAGLLAGFNKTLRVSLEEYAKQYLPNVKYQEILQTLAFVGGSQTARLINSAQRDRILSLLKKGNIDGAYEMFLATPRNQ